MSWQDTVIAAGQVVFAIALIPALRSPQKPPLFTCYLTGIILCTYAFAFGSLALWGSAAMSFICGAMWIALGVQERP